MGLKLRYHLFRNADPGALYRAYAECYAAAGHPLRLVTAPAPEDEWYEARIHAPNAGWTMLDSHGGWEWELRRRAQLYASRTLRLAGLLVWVFDGDYWLYELFNNGEVLDQFSQDPSAGESCFPGKDCTGQASTLVKQFPWISPDNAAAYMVRQPVLHDDDSHLPERWAEYDRLNVPARPGDEFPRFDECAVVDFLRALGVRVALHDHLVRLESPVCRTFRIADDFWLHQ